MSNSLSDVPVEVMYKYLLRDYRALQEENKHLKAQIQMLTENKVDKDSEEFRKLVEKYGQEYHRHVREKLKNKITELKEELSALKSQS